MSKTPFIVGAGLSGLLAAHAFPKAPVFEAHNEHDIKQHQHRALLRFRSDAVSRLTGIPFRKVRVQKGIILNGSFVQPDIAVNNMYAAKVLKGSDAPISGRSVMNIDPVDRWVAPNDFVERLTESVADRITYATSADFRTRHKDPIINTAPLHIVTSELDIDPQHDFERAQINVERWLLSGVDLHQTIYFPGNEMSVYSASITGNMLIVESTDHGHHMPVANLLDHFGLLGVCECTHHDSTNSKYGKIVDMPAEKRRALLLRLTRDHNIYSVGRFATWRNVLLDDVVQDLQKIKGMIETDDYSRALGKPFGGADLPF